MDDLSEPGEKLELCLLGPFAARAEGRALPPTRTRKGQWLLALLALWQGREVERAYLAALLWPDSSQTAALANLRNSLTDLRRVLGPAAACVGAPTPHTLRLVPEQVWIDIVAFEAAIERGELDRAVALYRGPLLEGCGEEWVVEERVRRERQFLDALERLADRAGRRGEWTAAEGLLSRVIAVDPLREEAHRKRMRALAEGGDTAAALDAYRTLRIALHRDLKAEPDAETTALFQRIREQARDSPGASGASPGSLPAALTRFIGREREAVEAGRLLAVSRLLTLTGAGGCGKTRLALRVAEERWADYADGVAWVDLAPLGEPTLVPRAVASALNVAQEPGCLPEEALIRHLRDRELLLVLDNCEHLAAACALLAERLLRAAPRLWVLATSRQPLGIAGEQRYRVPSLVEPEAVQLFADRAARVDPAFALTEENEGEVLGICRRLDGIALAIELAAAWTALLPVGQIAARLGERFRLLDGDPAEGLPRHRTLRASIDWSYRLLSEPERRLLRRLSVFAGGWTLPAAEAVCSDCGPQNEVLPLLSRLLDRSLIQREDRESGTRYRLLEMIREYAAERLEEAGEGAAARDRHRVYFLCLAEEAEPECRGPEVAAWLDRLEADRDNLRAALRWSLDPAGGAWEEGLRLAGALDRFWTMRGYWREGEEWLRRLLALPGAAARAAPRAKALEALARLMECLFRDNAASQTLCEESLGIWRELGDRRGTARTLHRVVNCRVMGDDLEAAAALNEEALAIWHELGDLAGIAYGEDAKAGLAWRRGDWKRVRAIGKRTLPIWRRLGDRRALANRLWNHGAAAFNDHDLNAARKAFQECREIATEIGDRKELTDALRAMSEIALLGGEIETGLALCEEGLSLARALGSPIEIGELLRIRGDLKWSEGDLAAARASYGEALALGRSGGHRVVTAGAERGLGRVDVAEGKPGAALPRYLEAARLYLAHHAAAPPFQRGTFLGRVLSCLVEMAGPAARLGKAADAARLLGAAAALEASADGLLSPREREARSRSDAAVRACLPADAFARAWAGGGALMLEQAVQCSADAADLA